MTAVFAASLLTLCAAVIVTGLADVNSRQRAWTRIASARRDLARRKCLLDDLEAELLDEEKRLNERRRTGRTDTWLDY